MIPVYELTGALSPERIGGLLFFHAFTGCDVASAFRGKGKKTAWQTWDVQPDASEVFLKLSSYPPLMEEEDIKSLERFVVTLYDRSSTTETVNDARLELFSKKQRPYKAIPPTRTALIQHSRRATFQAACIWSQALECQIKEESPAEWGWTKEGDCWRVLWTTLPTIAKSCQQFKKCGCNTPCNANGQCKCYRSKLPCTPLCPCSC